jgi:hypothetical protein
MELFAEPIVQTEHLKISKIKLLIFTYLCQLNIYDICHRQSWKKIKKEKKFIKPIHILSVIQTQNHP